MHYYKYNGKLIPIHIVGVDTDAPFNHCEMNVIVKSDVYINERIDITKITSLNNMYSNTKDKILLPISDMKEGDLVVFIDNNAEVIHNNSGNIGWCDEMSQYFNKIGIYLEDFDDNSFNIMFNEERTWTIIPSCLLKVSDSIKKL